MTLAAPPRRSCKRPPVVLGLGNGCVDTVLRVTRLPAPGGKAVVESGPALPGGQIASALVACCRLGLAARYFLRRGDDAPGAQLEAALQLAGVDLSLARTLPGVPTAAATIVVEASGERIVLWHTDPRLAVAPTALTPAAFAGVAALLLDGRDHPAALRAAQIARQRGIPVISDTDAWYDHSPELLPWIDHCIGPEAIIHAGLRGPAVMVATRGARGAVAWSAGRECVAPGFTVTAVDTTGAGDAFHAGYICGLFEGLDLPARLRLANATAALACCAPGAQTGLPTRAAVAHFLAQHPA